MDTLSLEEREEIVADALDRLDWMFPLAMAGRPTSLPVVGGPADCRMVENDAIQPIGARWLVTTDDGYDCGGWPMVLAHEYRITDLDGVESLLYRGVIARSPRPTMSPFSGDQEAFNGR